MAEEALFAAEAAPAVQPPWPVLIVDDVADMHAVTKLAMRGFTFEGRAIEWLSAHSATEARDVLAARRDIALVLLDVVMETDRAGLELARHIRSELGDRCMRIVLRTGEPGEAPPLAVVDEYEIDDYYNKTEMTFERLTILLKSALRTHRLLRRLVDDGAGGALRAPAG